MLKLYEYIEISTTHYCYKIRNALSNIRKKLSNEITRLHANPVENIVGESILTCK